MTLDYLRLPFGSQPPAIIGRPFRAVVVVEETVTDDWRDKVSDWLVETGCLYMMAWGEDCAKWDDSVDHANLSRFDYGDIPDDKFVMTTWHERETLADVFAYAKNLSFHDTVDLNDTLIVHISPVAREAELLETFRKAKW